MLKRLLAALAALTCALACASPVLASFGLQSAEISPLNQNGSPDLQAGSHPYELVTTFMLDEPEPVAEPVPGYEFAPVGPKGVSVELPRGLIGNPTATPRCSAAEFAEISPGNTPNCQEASVVGYADTFWTLREGKDGLAPPLPNGASMEESTAPVYNLQPPPGVPAEFAYKFENAAPIYLPASLRAGGDYGITIDVTNLPTSIAVLGSKVVLWGVPAEASHDPLRGQCLEKGAGPNNFEKSRGECPANVAPRPLLSTPTVCDTASAGTISADSWEEPGTFSTLSVPFPEMYGCERLIFTPSLALDPESSSSDSPSGLSVDLHIPQEESPGGLNESELKDATVTLPAGVTVNPSAASGMVGCPLLTGKEAHPGQVGIDLENAEMAACPNGSKIGSVQIETPLLEEELTGGIYVAQQNANPFKSLLALYIAAEAPERGVVVKLAGHVELDPDTGQLTTTFAENPQLPFETLKLDFFGGEEAPLATPRGCGAYTATSVLAPWSGDAPADPNALFQITSGPGGSACGSPAFAPAFEAGTRNNHGGSYSAFVMNLTRSDGEQRLGTVAMTLPPGIAAEISKVTRCPEAAANAGTCPASSKIGHVTVQAGVGSEPVTLPEAGKPQDPVYLTEKYDGAPFGLAVVVPAEAGPFDLGTVVVRAKIEVNPDTAQVTVVSNPMPTMLQGIPLDVKAIHVEIDRPEFMLNPTSCAPMSVSGTIGSAEGATVPVTEPFQAASCGTLPFHPKFNVSTQATVSRRDGASLKVTIAQKSGEADLHKVEVQLPKILPSRLETLKLACAEQQFDANPAACPAESKVGMAVVHTPILNAALEGPAILVSHGGEAFPDLDLVLQGEGITIIATGHTQIKNGVTYSRFETIPDAPVSSVELNLPEGRYSVLAAPNAKGSLCGRKLLMPTTIEGQNGALVERRVRIEPEGCSSALSIRSHHIKKRRLTLKIYVPGAGKLHVGGKGLSSQTRKTGQMNIVTVKVHEKRAGKLKSRVSVVFTPSTGKSRKRQVKGLSVEFRAPKRRGGHHGKNG